MLHAVALTEAPEHIRLLEVYADEAAIAAHRDSAHFRGAGPALGAVLAGAPELELLDTVG